MEYRNIKIVNPYDKRMGEKGTVYNLPLTLFRDEEIKYWINGIEITISKPVMSKEIGE